MNMRGKNGRRVEPTIELMPLIDVVFLLLIFFLITTSFAQTPESQIPVNLPSGVSGVSSGQGEQVVFVVTPDGGIEIEGNVEVPEGSLDERLEWIQREKPEVNMLLKGDSEASHGRVVEILDLIKAKGFKKVNLVIKKQQ